MNDATLVRCLQRVGDLLSDPQDLVKRDAVAFFQSVDGRDVWMIQGGEDFGFALKSREPIVVRSE
jgi:hypothetical protein